MSVNIKTQSGLKRFAGNTISTTATPLMSGLMSAEDKQKLDSIGGIGVEHTLLGWDNDENDIYITYETLKDYDFVYVQSGYDYTSGSQSLYSEIYGIIPQFVLKDFYNNSIDGEYVLDERKVLLPSSTYFLTVAYTDDNNHSFEFSSNCGCIGVWGLKIKGQTASGGGKTLIIDSDSAEAETYTIVGSEDATLLNLEMYGEVGSTKGTGMYLIYSNGSKGTSSTITTLGTTLITYSMASNGTLNIGKKANVKLKVWAEGSGYTVTKQ